jgi:predicted RNA polymerase sigma factor
VVAINRALAIAEVHGARAALDAMPDGAIDVRLVDHQPYWAARVGAVGKAGSYAEVRYAYEVAIGLERDSAVRNFLQRRQSALPA